MGAEKLGGGCTVILISSGGHPCLSGGDGVLRGREWFVAVCRVRALGGCHGVMRRCTRCHGSR